MCTELPGQEVLEGMGVQAWGCRAACLTVPTAPSWVAFLSTPCGPGACVERVDCLAETAGREWSLSGRFKDRTVVTPWPQPHCCPALGASGMGAPHGAGGGAGLPEGLDASEAYLSQVMPAVLFSHTCLVKKEKQIINHIISCISSIAYGKPGLNLSLHVITYRVVYL